jgi:hypothetical protein
MNLIEYVLDFIRMILEKNQTKLELNQSELDFIRMLLDFIILILKAKLDFASIELEKYELDRPAETFLSWNLSWSPGESISNGP